MSPAPAIRTRSPCQLASAPAAGKDVTVAIGISGANGKRIATADKNKLTFTSSTYNTAQTVTITGVVDNDAVPMRSGNVIVTASQDGPFAGLSRSIPVTVTDNSKDDGIIVTRNGAAAEQRSPPGLARCTRMCGFRSSRSSDVNVSVSASPSSPVNCQRQVRQATAPARRLHRGTGTIRRD